MTSAALASIARLERPLTLSRALAGFDAMAVGDIARLRHREQPGHAVTVVHVARDEQRLTAFARALGFFAPDIRVIEFPAWDCLPYDRVGPNASVASRRLKAMADLWVAGSEGHARGPCIVVTTVSAALQRVPTRDAIADRQWRAGSGSTIEVDGLVAFLEANGYQRSGTVVEPGEYAVRGGIIDVFGAGEGEPVRLDLFGKTLESVRAFDPESQRTTRQLRAVVLLPVSEVVFDAAAVSRFRQGYVARFGPARDADPLYESVSAGRRYRGVEHWLPLFHERLDTVFGLAGEAVISIDHLGKEAARERLDQIADHYENRRSAPAGSTLGAPVYKPLAPDALYLSGEEWGDILSRPHLTLSAFAAADMPASVGGEVHSIDLGARPGRDFAPERNQEGASVFDAAAFHIGVLVASGRDVIVTAASDGARDRLAAMLDDHGLGRHETVASLAAAQRLAPGACAFATLDLDAGFEVGDLAVLSEQDILGARLVGPRRRARRAQDFLTEVTALSPGDLVVHVDHGIARFAGLASVDVVGAPHDCLELHYQGGDKLYVPVENIEILSRYGHEGADVTLDRLGGAGWQARKAEARERIRQIADQLIKVAAARALRPGVRIVPDAGLYSEFCARFPFDETDDQQRSIDTVLDDLSSGRPMDRLVCGDVGFGKTEVALRSAFATASAGYQCAVVVPTTLLARQHFITFADRFRGFPIKVAAASRLVGAKELAETRKGLADGSIDIVIGTHALLAKDIEFQRLGLVIVDEEQHFGVTHKERLKEMRHEVHVLTLTATPIPRTLQLALSGVRDLSLIASPPVDRLAVRTFVTPFDPVVVREALLRELYRGGQSFFVCPRIADLRATAEFLADHVPEVRVARAHGRMAARDLDRVMNAFYEGAFDVLLSTAIVESGLDIPSANTLIVYRADRFGLSQLHQLRGRVGRSKTRAYALFTVPADRTLSEGAEKRLKVLQSLDSLGAGFTLASHDLDIRGAGNLLGEEQSGHIREVGFELYQSMLEEAVASLRQGEPSGAGDETWSPAISVGAAVLIPERYVPDLQLRLGLYRRLSTMEEGAALDSFAAELVDRFGPLPTEAEHLLRVVAIKLECRKAGISRLDVGPKGAVVSFRNNVFADPSALIAWIQSMGPQARIRPDQKVVISRSWEDSDARLRGAEALARQIARMAVREQDVA